MKVMSELRSCARCGWARYKRGKGRHVATMGTSCVSCRACWTPPKGRMHSCGLRVLGDKLSIEGTS